MADVAVLPPATHSQPSRKGKKAWRKNVDLTEIDDGLDTLRQEIIAGGVIAEKSADELFFVDDAGDKQIGQQQPKKLLKADEILAQRSAVPGLDGKKRKVADAVITTSNKRPRDGKYVSHKELQRLKRFTADPETVAELDSAAHDPWAVSVPQPHDNLDFVQKPGPVREPVTLRRAPVALTENGKKMPALLKPEAGKSYNPNVDDWSEVLLREGQTEVQAETQRIAAERLAEEKQLRAEEEAAKADAAEQEEWMTDYESDWDGFQSEAERQTFTVKAQRRKTPAERNKIKARKEREALEKMQRKQKERDQQQERISAIAKEMSARDKSRSSAIVPVDMLSDSDETTEPTLRRARFGRMDVPSAPLEVVLPEELEDSLRRLKPEGDLMTDRYRNILINGKMEIRKRRGQHKKRKEKATEKWTYKDWKLK